MEFKQRSNRRWVQNIVKFVVFGLFTAKAQAQVLPAPSFVVQPVGISVLNGDSVTLTMSAASLPLPITGVTWYCNGKSITNTNATANVSTTTINLGASATSVLNIKNFSNGTSGNYTVKVANASGSVTSTNAALILVTQVVSNVITTVTSGTGMVASGFKLQFSAPAGSNVVIQATSDLSHWSSLTTNTATSGSVTYTDTVAKTVTCRFYRAKLQ